MGNRTNFVVLRACKERIIIPVVQNSKVVIHIKIEKKGWIQGKVKESNRLLVESFKSFTVDHYLFEDEDELREDDLRYEFIDPFQKLSDMVLPIIYCFEDIE